MFFFKCFFFVQAHLLQHEQLTDESFLWINNLAVLDPYHVLPGLYFISACSVMKYRLMDSHLIISSLASKKSAINLYMKYFVFVFVAGFL